MAILVGRLRLRNDACVGRDRRAARGDIYRAHGVRAVFSVNRAAAGMSHWALISIVTSDPAVTGTEIRRSSGRGNPTGPASATPTPSSAATSAASVPVAGALTRTRRQTYPQ